MMIGGRRRSVRRSGPVWPGPEVRRSGGPEVRPGPGVAFILDDCAKFLETNWRLQIKASSRSIAPVHGSGPIGLNGPKWTITEHSRCLGSIVQNNGLNTDWDDVVRVLWKAFWKECGSSRAKDPPLTKMLFC